LAKVQDDATHTYHEQSTPHFPRLEISTLRRSLAPDRPSSPILFCGLTNWTPWPFPNKAFTVMIATGAFLLGLGIGFL